MHETYRMLGREHEADLEREAERRRLATTAKDGRSSVATAPAAVPHRRRSFVRRRVLALLFGHERA